MARLKSKLPAESPELKKRLQHLTETLNSGIALKRRIIETLRPSSLSNLGLSASLGILTREFSEQSELPVRCDIEDVVLDEAAQLTVYRLVQESLTNVGKYAEAGAVDVRVCTSGDGVEVVVQDDGAGFDPEVTRAERPRASGHAPPGGSDRRRTGRGVQARHRHAGARLAAARRDCLT